MAEEKSTRQLLEMCRQPIDWLAAFSRAEEIMRAALERETEVLEWAERKAKLTVELAGIEKRIGAGVARVSLQDSESRLGEVEARIRQAASELHELHIELEDGRVALQNLQGQIANEEARRQALRTEIETNLKKIVG